MLRKHVFLLVLSCLLAVPVAAAQQTRPEVILVSQNPKGLELLAAKEVRRYLYLRTGQLLPIACETFNPPGCAIAVGREMSEYLAGLAGVKNELKSSADALRNQQYLVKTLTGKEKRYLTIVGGDDVGTLYGAYRFAELLGVRFYLHGDTIPDGQIELCLPDANELGKPLFELRGIHPFHDFPEGPDWWNTDDYKAVIAQLPKLRMNFFALHTYPEKRPNAEPTVWIGLSDDIEPDGKVRSAYPSSYQNTLRGNWGYAAKKTSEFNLGSSMLFERDDYGADVMIGMCPQPQTPQAQMQLFNRTADMLKDAFEYAHRLGVKTCAGTETPLVIPQAVKKRLIEQGKDPNNPNTTRELYEGLFERIKRACPIDYYWLWTPENWTWQQVKDEEVAATEKDLLLAVEAAKKINAPFTLATCGWVLGPPKDRTRFDSVLPKEIPFSCINREVGFSPIDANFTRLIGRGKWAIPWLEDDPALASPQLWVGRMRRDAVDAFTCGCTGLMGIHWRTRILGPNVSALAKAAWEQNGWSRPAIQQSAEKLRDLPSEDFYRDWAAAEFGQQPANEIAALFVRLDGGGFVAGQDDRHAKFPRSSQWLDGPGAIRVNKKPWSEEAKSFGFVDEFAKLRSKIKGRGNIERFDYWLNTFQYAKAMGEVGCIIGGLEATIKRIEKQSDSKTRKKLAQTDALPARKKLAEKWSEMETCLLQTVSNTGEMGTVANLEQHSMNQLRLLNKYDKTLEQLLGNSLPADYRLRTDYRGKPRLIVPTVRTNLCAEEDLKLKVIVLANGKPASPVLYWRQMGSGGYNRIDFTRVARSVFTAAIPAKQVAGDIEYYVECSVGWGKKIYFPAAAPQRNQTVILN